MVTAAGAFVLLLRIMDLFKTFDVVYTLTQGGPGTATETLLYKIADPRGIRSIGTRASLSIGLFVLTAGVAGIQYSLLSKRVHYGE